MLESELVEVTGIPRIALRDFRFKALTRGVHWDIGKNGAVTLSQTGLEAVAGEFDVDVPGILKKTAKHATVTIDVTALTRNKHVMLGDVRGDSEKTGVRIEVRDSSRFQQGMAIECEHVQDDYWRFTGRMPSNKLADV